MNALTHHMVDDERIEQIMAWAEYKKPMAGGRAAMEDRALSKYFHVLETTGDHALAQKAFFDSLQSWKQ